MSHQTIRYLAAVDLGKSRCRVAIARLDGAIVAGAEGRGAAGLADPAGADEGAMVVAELIDAALGKIGTHDASVSTIVVGAAGGETAVDAPASLARQLAERCAAPRVAVTTDAVTSHAGAMAGRSGVVLAAGTGLVAWGLSGGGRAHRVDGWGQWLGDDGGGAWIGREALRLVLRAADGRGLPTDLTQEAERHFGSLRGIPALLPFRPDLPGATAAFVPAVVRCARAGDDAATALLREAAAHWAESTATAARAVGERHVTCVGGLAAVDELRVAWEGALPDDLAVGRARGTSLDGAILLATRDDLPHESHVRRFDYADIAR